MLPEKKPPIEENMNVEVSRKMEEEQKTGVVQGEEQKEGAAEAMRGKAQNASANESAPEAGQRAGSIEGAAQEEKQKKNVFTELTETMKGKRELLLSKIDRIKELRNKLDAINKSGVKALEKRKERLEFKVATEAITLEKERELMKSIKGLNEEIKRAQSKEGERKELLAEIKALDEEIEKLKNELDEMKLNLIELREERKKRRVDARKKREEHEAKPHEPRFKKEELIVNLEDIVVIKKPADKEKKKGE